LGRGIKKVMHGDQVRSGEATQLIRQALEPAPAAPGCREEARDG
jgi:hypothetical protein